MPVIQLVKAMSSSLRIKPPKGTTFKSYVADFTGSTHTLQANATDDTPSTFHSSTPPEANGANYSQTESPTIELKPSLLPGEVIVAQADNALKYNTFSNLKTGISGALFCTNFKLSFVTTEKFETNICQRHLILGEDDICLINIQCVYLVSGGKKKKLVPGSQLPERGAEIIEVHCKNFKIYTFSFKFSPKGHDKIILGAICRHAFVSRINMLFIFDYKGSTSNSSADRNGNRMPWSRSFTYPSEWISELKRCGCPGWRASLANEEFHLCDNLPESFVVPASLLDTHLQTAAPNFVGCRVLTWSWGASTGSALVRMAKLDPVISNQEAEDSILEAVRRSHPLYSKGSNVLEVVDLDASCPSIKDIQTSFQKLQELCMPTDPQEFWEQDAHYLSSLESTRWLHNVSACLSTAARVASHLIDENKSVVIQELEGRDLCCVISSLVQILVDPYFRTQEGFQRLVQKEWVAMGHPFTERLQHVRSGDGEQCPVFLLFLDCVWQLQYQHPSRFEFSETYLTTLWDTTHISIFDTFLFSCQKQRNEIKKVPGTSHISYSAWNWSAQFSQRDINYFSNPLYCLMKYRKKGDHHMTHSFSHGRPRSVDSRGPSGSRMISQMRPLTLGSGARIGTIGQPVQRHPYWMDEVLEVSSGISALRVWMQCYQRWLPLAQVVGGGLATLFVSNLLVAEEICALEAKLKKLTACLTGCPPTQLRHRRVASDDYLFTAEVDSCDSLRQSCQVVTSVFPFSPPGPLNWGNFRAIPSSSCLYITHFGSQEELDD